MRNTLVFLNTLLLLVSCNISCTQNTKTVAGADTVFSFAIKDYYDESSKDSHEYSKTYSLKKGVLYYDYVYTGYPDDEEKHSKKDLNDEAVEKIKTKLKDLSLYCNYKKEFPIDERGMITKTGYILSITTDTAKYRILVSGNRPIEIEDEVYNKLSEFFSFLSYILPEN